MENSHMASGFTLCLSMMSQSVIGLNDSRHLFTMWSYLHTLGNTKTQQKLLQNAPKTILSDFIIPA